MKTLKRLSGCLRKRFLCQKKGSLGVKTLELFNISLLAKWRCLVDCDVLWYDLLEFKYGPLNSNIFWMKGFLLMLQDGEGTWSQLNLLGGETLSGFQMQWAKN